MGGGSSSGASVRGELGDPGFGTPAFCGVPSWVDLGAQDGGLLLCGVAGVEC